MYDACLYQKLKLTNIIENILFIRQEGEGCEVQTPPNNI